MIGPEPGHVTLVLTSDWPQPPHQRRDAAEPQDRRDRAVRVRQGRVQPHPQEWSHRRGSLHHSRQKWSRGKIQTKSINNAEVNLLKTSENLRIQHQYLSKLY